VTYTLELKGTVPCKKNRWHRGRNGAVYFDEAPQKQGNIQALLDALQLQVQAAWKRPTIERVAEIRALFIVQNGRSDLDGKYTTLQDVLVKAGVLRNDSILRLQGFRVRSCIRPQEEERTEVEVVEG
jgi:Holliday junction resolvase RusA-like endonuclease